MPWIEFIGPELTQEERKNLGVRISESLGQITGLRKEAVKVHFVSYDPDHLWLESRMSSASLNAFHYMRIFPPPLTAEQKLHIYRQLTEIVGEVLDLSQDRISQFGISIHEVSPDNYGIGGVPFTQLNSAYVTHPSNSPR